ncbi:hypothetical protein HanPSC8_Chr10g0426341 [Helianthus annuus]|nr:hypothetical protein HanPSC8_Chr10g0426341 [Helianthus annuus]
MILRTIYQILRSRPAELGIYTHACVECELVLSAILHIREIESFESILSRTHTHTLESL